MAGNTFGQILRLTTFGESHGKAIGGILDGFPAGIKIDESIIQNDLDRRKPGQSKLVSPRNEDDKIELLSGIFEGKSLGTPIAFLIWNKDQKPADYKHISKAYRPSHADFTFEKKYGVRDYRGGGRSSARETVARVVGGAFAKMILKNAGIGVAAYVSKIGSISINEYHSQLDMSKTEESLVRCPDDEVSTKMIKLIEEVQKQGDTLGGEIKCVIKNTPIGLGEPVFDKLHADLGKAMLSINAVKGFEIGSGFSATSMKGSEHNDKFEMKGEDVITTTNYSGGIQGGISNGSDIYFTLAFKPVATLMRDQATIDSDGNPVVIKGKGRHDVTVVPRAVPIVEAMAAMVIADHYLRNLTSVI